VNGAPEGALSITVLPAGRMFGRVSQKKKSERPDKSAAENWGRVFPERAKKELNFETALKRGKMLLL
jgi:hypothetical protein